VKRTKEREKRKYLRKDIINKFPKIKKLEEKKIVRKWRRKKK